jgi:hypothetical protein
MTMRKTWILAGAFLAVATSAMEAGAHGKSGGRQGGMGMGPGMGMRGGPRVSLSTQLGLSEEQQTQLDALKATYEEKEITLHDEQQAAFKALLSEEQQTALDAAAATRGRHRRGPALNLSEEQQTQLEALRTEFRDQHEALRTEFQTAFEDLLSEEQLTKLAELRAAGPFGMCIGAGVGTGTSSTGTTTGSTATLSAAKAVVSDDEPATGDQSTSWGQLKNRLAE